MIFFLLLCAVGVDVDENKNKGIFQHGKGLELSKNIVRLDYYTKRTLDKFINDRK